MWVDGVTHEYLLRRDIFSLDCLNISDACLVNHSGLTSLKNISSGGKTGVFEIEDLVSLLQRENSKDIFVATVPQSINYVDYICVVSARSKRHILALAEFVRKVYKKKCYKTDSIPRIEGKDSEEWMALDLGNIALHIFSEKARKVYDLDSLWAVGPEYDEQMNKKHDVADIFQNYSEYLKDLKPLA
ncbi:mitochondrial assembly of ribosomal large subunit protein 1 isoform X2 [Leguminivora glycinivorella]|uniref:mitochondrial assembly of ribosomal large subunit protein 1 isoform X2 n=1 Tax=Leguminivora glycinivorella TaxID=1035111 RepID=UPI0020103103|nr:mitochondrial assembly of ribosomal large subunit protein 1 isoform X2 [Leguminivora glycinivorella]XP_047986860.1 mitochondrial assembly of ribosomal large subunit protein 1 isoform X2 [Leguminivora glycinivorella]